MSPQEHPYDSVLSGGLRFLTELIAWVAGPWAASLYSNWLILPALVLLVSLPSIFSTLNDKNVAGVSVVIVLATIIMGVPRMLWLLRGAPA